MVKSFRYLGRVISVADDNCPELIRNMSKARTVWSNMMNILSREGARTWFFRFLFKAVVRYNNTSKIARRH